jgi:hypothetical protein
MAYLQRKAPLKPRKAPLRRSPVKSRRKPKSHAETRGGEPFLDYLHGCPCVFRFLGPCTGPIQAAHLTPKRLKSMGKKGDWTWQAPVCLSHHQDWDQYRGDFEGWDAERREIIATEFRDWIQRSWVAYQGLGL